MIADRVGLWHALALVVAIPLILLLSPILLLLTLFCSESREDSYKYQNW